MKIDIIDLKKSILENNDEDAEKLREELRKTGLFYLNVMSSPGAGKTSVLLRLTASLRKKYRIGVMEADIDADVDARTIAETGIPAVQLHTGGMCHLDAQMSRQGLRALGAALPDGARADTPFDLVILENVGNLVCPAEFDTGAHADMVILSVPEGDDKPLKYPLMFETCGIAVINKIDALPAFPDFSMERVRENILRRNPQAEIVPVSARTGEGTEQLAEIVKKEMERLCRSNSASSM